MSKYADRFERSIKAALARDAIAKRRGQRHPYTNYPSLSQMRSAAPDHVKAQHAAHGVQIEKRIKLAGIRWYYDKDYRDIYGIELATGEVVKSKAEGLTNSAQAHIKK